ncbi:MAG: hypothetical protein RBR47_06185 [Bacteroidales bacterium]|nr:hypothetical protein [Bacteroidales bacterium]NCU34885.1 hypothetical protein [Candidatus Falkowbacteria bacterium]MDD3528208.1 hypothetical protein [Bacteroidales bacterium]MDD4177276.1 hypothetical protein [Bacteroidales bacterium]MDD4741628.1 hypothetical protein [Bacteroidales bacterium]
MVMNGWDEIFKYTLPALLVLLLAYGLVVRFLRQERWYREQNNAGERRKDWIKIKLLAYERIMLFLERINPEHLVMRLASDYPDALRLQQALLQNIRDEYEHNLVQQLYVSDAAWQAATDARNQVVQWINEAARQTDRQAETPQLATAILQLAMQTKNDPIASAIKTIKDDVRELMESSVLK